MITGESVLNTINNLSGDAFLPIKQRHEVSDQKHGVHNGKKHIEDEVKVIPHNEILPTLLEDIQPLDFRALAGDEIEEDGQLKQKHCQVLIVRELLTIVKQKQWGLCLHNEMHYVYNGAYWSVFDESQMISFLGDVAKKMGIKSIDAEHYQFQDNLLRQFEAGANLTPPEQTEGKILINLKNGTFEIDGRNQHLRKPDPKDFLRYQLPFAYQPEAKASMFQRYLDRVLPDKDAQNVLAEYIGYIFTPLKLEKVLLLYGSGANGKSVFFEIIQALIGRENTANYSLHSLTDTSGYYRAMLQNKLVNYASEINGKLEADVFKQLASGEPVEARLPYSNPITLRNYAKLIFNTNELPTDVEQTEAFFRRFLIIHFAQTIPEEEQDKELADIIFGVELSVVFNWVLDGLNRLITQKKFSRCEASEEMLRTFRKESDSVQMFLSEEEYEPCNKGIRFLLLKDLYSFYRIYCSNNGYRSVSNKNFRKRLDAIGINSSKGMNGIKVFVVKNE